MDPILPIPQPRGFDAAQMPKKTKTQVSISIRGILQYFLNLSINDAFYDDIRSSSLTKGVFVLAEHLNSHSSYIYSNIRIYATSFYFFTN